MIVNRKRVARIMREDNLLAIQPRSFVVTTDSDHELEVYLNVASRMKVKGVNQLWVADITYIRLKTEFVYFAVILDAHSRKVARSDARYAFTSERAGTGDRGAATATWLGAPLRPRRAVRFWRLREDVEEAPVDPQHEPAGEPLRQCQL